jgi:hypothetical protein
VSNEGTPHVIVTAQLSRKVSLTEVFSGVNATPLPSTPA